MRPTGPRMTAHVFPAGGLPSGTRRTCDWEGAGLEATKHGFIARANIGTIAQWLGFGKGPFTSMPQGRGPLASMG